MRKEIKKILQKMIDEGVYHYISGAIEVEGKKYNFEINLERLDS